MGEVGAVVVGGGIAGLFCARTLSRAGFAVTLYERDGEVGGRVRTTLHQGYRLDHGFQVLFTAYPTLAAALGVPLALIDEHRFPDGESRLRLPPQLPHRPPLRIPPA